MKVKPLEAGVVVEVVIVAVEDPGLKLKPPAKGFVLDMAFA